MDPTIKQRWLAALRSGEYQQGRCNLRTAPATIHDTKEIFSYCCLGVLCDIVAAELPSARWEYQHDTHDDGVRLSIYSMLGNSGEVPDAIAALTGVSGLGPLAKPVVYGNHRWNTLSGLNDAGAPFSVIADIIEEQF